LKPATVDDKGLTGEVIALDGPFGNLITNISADDFLQLGYQRGDKLKVTIAGREVEMHSSGRSAMCRSNSHCCSSIPADEPALRSTSPASRRHTK